MAGGSVARVLVDSPLPQLDQLFDYAVPERLRDAAVAGVRVRVPLRSGGRIANGWLVEIASSSEFEGRLSELEDVVSEVPLLTPEVWALARAAADRAAGNAGDILRVAIPSRYVRAERAWRTAEPDP
ncbi:MAG: primosomal protein N', partial [Agromyces sp.]